MLDILLNQIGFDRKEAIVYLTLLSLGTQRATIVAKKSGVKRSTAHLVLSRLIEKGYVSTHFEKNIEFFTPIPPEKILEHLENEKKQLTSKQELIKSHLNEFESILSPYTSQPKVSYFNGIEGIKYVMEDTLTSKTEILCYSPLDDWFSNEELRKYIVEYGKRRVKKYKIPLRAIDTDSLSTRKYREVDYPRSEKMTKTRWLPKDILAFNNEINIYDNKLAICSLAQGEYLGVIVESKSIADTQRSIFELAWLSALPAKSYR